MFELEVLLLILLLFLLGVNDWSLLIAEERDVFEWLEDVEELRDIARPDRFDDVMINVLMMI